MQITERDIFDYVQDKETLSPEKRLYIEENYELFDEIISFYYSFKNSLDESIPPDTISAFECSINYNKIISLYPVAIIYEQEKAARLAAGSIQNDQSVKALSFTDKDAKHIIRALFFPDKTELFVLTSGDQKLTNFSIITKPSLKEYFFKDNQRSVTTTEKIIEQIDILYH